MRVIDFLQMRVIDQIYSGSHHSHVINCKSNNCLLQILSLTNCDNDPDDRPTLMSVLLGTSCVVSVTNWEFSAEAIRGEGTFIAMMKIVKVNSSKGVTHSAMMLNTQCCNVKHRVL